MFSSLILAAGIAWTGVTQDCHLSGRKVSEGYLQGKVVLVDRWGYKCPPCRQLMPRLEAVWQSYKSKPFVLLGGHCPGWGTKEEVAELAKELELTYPLYEGAGLKEKEPEFDAIPFLYVIDATGRIVYRGRDERQAEAAVVTALTNLASPPNRAYWQRLIAAEVDVLPGRAYLHIEQYRKFNTRDPKAFEDELAKLKEIKNIKKLANLEGFSRSAKDSDPTNKRAKVKISKAKIEMAIKNFEELKKSDNPVVVQEAKNCLADLTWALQKY